MRRVANFYMVIDTDDEEVAQRWLATVNVALDNFAHQAAKICAPGLSIVAPCEAGQYVMVEGEDVPPTA